MNIMPGCINYTGRERTPLGSGLSAKYEPVGRMYIVRYVGLNTKRWMYMWWLEDTQV